MGIAIEINWCVMVTRMIDENVFHYSISCCANAAQKWIQGRRRRREIAIVIGFFSGLRRRCSVVVIRRPCWPVNGGANRDWWRDHLRRLRRGRRGGEVTKVAMDFRTCWLNRLHRHRIRHHRPYCSLRVIWHRRLHPSICPWSVGGRSWKSYPPLSVQGPIVWLSSPASPWTASLSPTIIDWLELNWRNLENDEIFIFCFNLENGL